MHHGLIRRFLTRLLGHRGVLVRLFWLLIPALQGAFLSHGRARYRCRLTRPSLRGGRRPDQSLSAAHVKAQHRQNMPFYAGSSLRVAQPFPHHQNRLFVLACAAWLFHGAAFGQAAPSWSLVPKAAETATGVSYSYSPSAAGNAVATTGRAVTVAANDAFIAAETATLSTPAGQTTVSLARGFTGAAARGALADAALAIGRGGLVGAGIAAGAALAPLLEQWMLDQGYNKNGDGSWGTGSAPTPTTVTAVGWFVPGTSLVGFANDYNAVNAAHPENGGPAWMQYCGQTPTMSCLRGGNRDAEGNYVYGVPQWTTTVYKSDGHTQICPDGMLAAGGVCAGAGGPPSLSPADVHAAAASAPNPALSDWQGALDNAATLGYAPELDPSPQVSGPSTVTSASTVTGTTTITQPGGATQTLTETQHQVAHLTYSGSQVRVDARTVTQTQNVDGSTTTTDKPTATAPDACVGFPGILGCTQLGTPEAASVPTSSKSIVFTPEAIDLPSTCPADISLGKYGSFSFATACSNAASIRPLVVAVGAFSALMICVGAVAGVKL